MIGRDELKGASSPTVIFFSWGRHVSSSGHMEEKVRDLLSGGPPSAPSLETDMIGWGLG